MHEHDVAQGHFKGDFNGPAGIPKLKYLVLLTEAQSAGTTKTTECITAER